MKKLTLCLSGMLFLMACGTIKYMPTSDNKYPAKPLSCDFKVFSNPPQMPYEEIGIVSMDSTYAYRKASNVEDFKKEMAGYVCPNGADAVIGTLNGLGQYVSGSVIVFKKSASK